MNRTKTVRPANDNGSAPAESQTLSLLLPLIDVLAQQAVRAVQAANDNRPKVGSSDLH
jgi:hypothetical protein